jgi:hypothetical protein
MLTVAGTLNPVKTPLVVTRPISPLNIVRNQSALSGPAAMPLRDIGVGTGYSVIAPEVEIRPIAPLGAPLRSVNHSAQRDQR